MSESLRQQAEFVDIRLLCRSFPPLPDQPIERHHILAELEEFFERGVDLVTVEGEEGKGKTTLLAQFALRHSTRVIGLFARPTSRHTYDPLYLLTDLCEQIHWLVYGEVRPETDGPPDDSEYRLLLTHAEGRARNERNPYYFLVDGLDEIPEEDAAVRDELLDLLPLGRSYFRFLYTGRPDVLSRLPERVRRSLQLAQYPLTRFSLEEVLRYLGNLGLEEGDARQLLELTHGLPGHLAVIRRLLLDGLPVEHLMSDMPKELSDLFEYEWRAIVHRSLDEADLLQNLLAILAHDRGHHTLGLLARLTGESIEKVKMLLVPLGFIRIDPGDDNSGEGTYTESDGESRCEVALIPEAFRTYAARRLAARECWVRERVVDDLTSHPDSDDALTRLPTSLAALGRRDALLRYLSPDYFVSLIERQRTLGVALTAASLGISEAEDARRDVELTQLSLTRALLLQFGHGSIDTEEVEAYMALGDENKALALALSAPLAEDRLELLATIAKVRRLRGNPISPEIQGQLEQLAIQVDPDALGERLGDLAVLLLFSLPDVALRFLEHARVAGASGNEDTIHQHLLTLESDPDVGEWLDATSEALGEARERFELLQASLTDPFTRNLTSVLSVVYGNHSAEEALEAVANIDRLQDQIFVLREWLWRNSKRADAARVVDEALDRLLRNSDEEMPDAAAFCDIAAPLAWLPDLEETNRLVGRFDTFADLIENHGPSRDYVRLQLRLARAECRYDSERAYNRLLEIWYYADARSDLVERAACIAHIVAAFESIAKTANAAGQQAPMPARDVAEIDTVLDQCVDQILRVCADQYHATRGIIRALASRHPRRALAIAARLNTNRRRLVATLDAVRPTLLNMQLNSAADAAVMLETAMQTLAGTAQGDIALLHVAEKVAALASPGGTSDRDTFNSKVSGSVEQPLRTTTVETTALEIAHMLAHFLPVHERFATMIDARQRVRALVLWEVALRRLAGNEGSGALSETIEDGRLPRGPITGARLERLIPEAAAVVDATWDDIEPGWSKVSLGFELAHLLAPDDPDRAKAYVAKAESARHDLRMRATNAAIPYTTCVHLMVRAYIAILNQDLATDDDLIRLGHAIDVLPGPGTRAAAWADVAVRCFLHQREDLGRQIVVDRIHLLLALVSRSDVELRRSVIGSVAPALYLAHQETAREWIRQIDAPYRDIIYALIAQVIVNQTPLNDPYTSGILSGRPLSWTEAVDICRLIEDINYDVPLYATIAMLADCIVSGRGVGKLSRDQQRQIAERVRTVVETHLPDPNNITHEGYKLIALAQAARMDPTTYTRRDIWMELAVQARIIPNESDRSFVLAHLATMTSNLEDRRAWLHEAEETITNLPARLNRIDDFIALAQLVLQANWGESGAALARRWLSSAMKAAAEDPEDSSSYAAQRRLIDLAFQFDEALARELARQIDDDPARLAHRLRALELKKSLTDATNTTSSTTTGLSRATGKVDAHEDDRLHEWVEACRLHLGALNAGRVSTLHSERLRQPLAEAAQLPLTESYPVYALSIENAKRRLGGSKMQARSTLRPLFEAIAQVTELAPRLVEDAPARAARAARTARQPADSTYGEQHSILIRSGHREEAQQVLRAWCAAHPSPYLKLSDRYFDPEQLDWIRLLAEAMPPGCQITVLTSRKGQDKAHVVRPWAQTYKLHWRLRVSDQDPPPIEIVILGTRKEGSAPFHDRRVVVAGAGLTIGTSFNALGGATDTTIDALTPMQVEETELDFDEWIRGGAWVYKGEQLLRNVFRLDDPDE